MHYYVVGVNGSGKTSLLNAISEKTGIAACTGEEVDYTYGFLNLRTTRDCGAFVLAIHRFRQSLYGSPYPKKP